MLLIVNAAAIRPLIRSMNSTGSKVLTPNPYSLHFVPSFLLFFSLSSFDLEDFDQSRLALIALISWLRSRTQYSVDTNAIVSSSAGPFRESSPSTARVSDNGSGTAVWNQGQSPHRVSFEGQEGTSVNRGDRYMDRDSVDYGSKDRGSRDIDDIVDNDDQSVTVLVERTKEMTSLILSDRETMISKQLTLLQVMEKQLESVQARLQLEVEGAGQAILRSPAPSSNHISSSSPSFAVTPSRSTGSSALIAASMINTSTYSFPYYHSLLSFY